MSRCFFFNDTATTEIYTLSLHDALPISMASWMRVRPASSASCASCSTASSLRWLYGLARSKRSGSRLARDDARSEEHTSELQSRQYLVCRLLLEKKKTVSPALISLLTAC